MRRLTMISMISILALTFCSVYYAQKMDTSTQRAYSKSLTKVYGKIPADNQLEFLAFFYCTLGNGKHLPRMTILDKGLKEAKVHYPIIQALEEKNEVALNGLAAAEISTQGKGLLSGNLRKKIESASDEKLKDNLKAQFELISKNYLTREDIEEYHRLRQAM